MMLIVKKQMILSRIRLILKKHSEEKSFQMMIERLKEVHKYDEKEADHRSWIGGCSWYRGTSRIRPERTERW